MDELSPTSASNTATPGLGFVYRKGEKPTILPISMGIENTRDKMSEGPLSMPWKLYNQLIKPIQ